MGVTQRDHRKPEGPGLVWPCSISSSRRDSVHGQLVALPNERVCPVFSQTETRRYNHGLLYLFNPIPAGRHFSYEKIPMHRHEGCASLPERLSLSQFVVRPFDVKFFFTIIFLNKLLWYSRNYIPPRWYSLDKWAVHKVNGDVLLAEVGGEEIADLNSSTEIVALSGLLTTHFC